MPDTPRVSVLMTTYNGAALIGQSIESVLSQTFADFELIVVDDASTDSTRRLLAGISDTRLRVIRVERNLGVVGARNHAFAAARGEFVAAHDHDDISSPERLAHQVACLDAHDNVVLVGTEIRIERGGTLELPDHSQGGHPLLMRWRCLIDNPLTYSSIMVRTAAVRRLGQFMREEFIYADDFDFYHRLLRIGDIVRLDAPLVRYRWHASNTTHAASKTMNANATKVLCNAYTALLGTRAEKEASLVIRHLSRRQPVHDPNTLDTLGAHLARLMVAFNAAHTTTADEQAMIAGEAAAAWWHCVRSAVRNGGPEMLASYRQYPTLADWFHPSRTDFLGSLAVGALRRVRQAVYKK